MLTGPAYYLLWLCGGLAAAAAASALLVWRLRRRALRQFKAIALLDALARSGDWVGAQRLALCFQGRSEPHDPALARIRALQEHWFPELASARRGLEAVDAQLAQLLASNEQLRRADPEACLESGSDAVFLALAREHEAALRQMEQRLATLAGSAFAPPQFTFR